VAADDDLSGDEINAGLAAMMSQSAETFL